MKIHNLVTDELDETPEIEMLDIDMLNSIIKQYNSLASCMELHGRIYIFVANKLKYMVEYI